MDRICVGTVTHQCLNSCNTCPRRPSEWLGAAICWENLFWKVWITVKTFYYCRKLDAVHLKLNNKWTLICPTWGPFVTFNWLHRAAFFLHLSTSVSSATRQKRLGRDRIVHFHRHWNNYYFSHSMTAVISPHFWMSPFEKWYTSLYNFGHHFVRTCLPFGTTVWKTHKCVTRRASAWQERTMRGREWEVFLISRNLHYELKDSWWKRWVWLYVRNWPGVHFYSDPAHHNAFILSLMAYSCFYSQRLA